MKHIFGAGTARGGTGLVVQTLRAHSDIELAMEPFLFLFKSYRAHLVNLINASQKSPKETINDTIGAIYFEEIASSYLEKILNKPQDFKINESEFKLIIDGIVGRAAYDAKDLIPYINTVGGSSYIEMVLSLNKMIATARGKKDVKWSGFMENWCVEFFPLLADFFPDSKFFIIMRDPRAVICSALNAPKELQSTFLSYVRALRKLYDLAIHYLGDPRFKNRLCIIKFESLVANPEKIVTQLCKFFEVNYEDCMIDPRHHVIPGTDEARDGVSSFEEKAVGYSESRTHRWKGILSSEIVSLVNALIEEEMKIFGYLDLSKNNELNIETILKGVNHPDMKIENPRWSTDFQSFSMNYGPELLRKNFLSTSQSDLNIDDKSIQELFLSKQIYEFLQHKNISTNTPHEWRAFSSIIKA